MPNMSEDADIFDASKAGEAEVAETKTEEQTPEPKPAEPETAPAPTPELKPESQPPAEDDEVFVELPTGDKVKVDELVGGYMKDKDYRQKTMTLADERRRFESERQQFLAATQGQRQPAPEAPNKDLEGYDQAQIAEFKKLARAVGFVAKEDLDELKAQESQRQNESTAKQIVGSFYATHPEYNQQNDPDGIKHRILNEALELYDWRNPSKMASALEKAHADAQAKIQNAIGGAKSAVAKNNLKTAAVGSGGGAGVAPKATTQNYTQAQLEVLEEFGLND